MLFEFGVIFLIFIGTFNVWLIKEMVCAPIGNPWYVKEKLPSGDLVITQDKQSKEILRYS